MFRDGTYVQTYRRLRIRFGGERAGAGSPYGERYSARRRRTLIECRA